MDGKKETAISLDKYVHCMCITIKFYYTYYFTKKHGNATYKAINREPHSIKKVRSRCPGYGYFGFS